MNDVLKSYSAYNTRRYSLPWVCRMSKGDYDFSVRVGLYTGRPGASGDLVVLEPVDGRVYAYGQKDYRGQNTEIAYAVWTDGAFRPCDRLGRLTSG